MADFKYEVKETIAVMSSKGNNSLELRKVSWDGKVAQYDIRPWYKDASGKERCAKGITLTKDQLHQLFDIIKGIEI